MRSSPCERAAIPAVAEESTKFIFARTEVLRDVVRLLRHPLSVICEIGREQITAHPFPIQVDALAAERSNVKSGTRNRP